MRKAESHSFGKKLKELRNEKGLTQEQLANELNKKYNLNESKPTISQYENNKRIPDLDRVINFADYFGISLDYIVNRDFNKSNKTTISTNKNKNCDDLLYINTFGERLKKLIKQNNLTQKEFMNDFNKKFGYSDSEATISQYVNNKRTPEIDKLIKIANYFNVSLDYFFNRNIINSTTHYADVNSNIITFPNRLRKLRKSANLSQVEFAKIMNVSNGSISKWENGERQPDFETLKVISNYFNVSIDYLIKGSDPIYQFFSINEVVKFILNQDAILKSINEDTQLISHDDLKKIEEDFIDILRIVLRKYKE